MANQAADLHRSLLRPMILHTLRGVGFHSTKPSVLDALTNIAERYLMLLALSTANQAQLSHNDGVATVSDVRHALSEVGALVPLATTAEEDFREKMRRPLEEYVDLEGGYVRLQVEKRRRNEQDVRDVQDFLKWFDGAVYAEIKRVAGKTSEDNIAGHVGVGGQAVHAEDFLTVLKRKRGKAGQDVEAKFAGTILGTTTEDSEEVRIDGGLVKSLAAWMEEQAGNGQRGLNGHAAKEIEIG